MTYFEDVSQENIIPLVPFWYLQLLFVKDELFFTCSIPILLNIFNFFSYVFLSPMCNFGYNFKTILDYFLQYAQIYFNYILFPCFFKARPNAINNILPGDKLIEFSSRFGRDNNVSNQAFLPKCLKIENSSAKKFVVDFCRTWV